MNQRLLATLLPVVALMAVPATGQAARKQVPDLAVTKLAVKQLPGDPPYLVKDSSGHTPGFVVRATTKNIGRVASKPSRTKLELSMLGGQAVHATTERVPKLKPHASHVSVFKVDLSATPPPLGLLRAVASADGARSVQEIDEQNNARTAPLIPVIAQQWKVLDFMTTDDLSGTSFPGALESHFTKACWQVDCGRYFVFRFSTFDETAKAFEYVPEGTIRAGWQYLYPPLNCTGNATEVRGPKTWPGQLLIGGDLDWYDGDIDVPAAEAPPAKGQIACPGSPTAVPVEWAFQPLATFVGEGERPTTPGPSATKLTGHTERMNVGNTKTTWQWTFQADVPGS